jgi:Flp pilus assembly protein TadG
MKKSLRQAKHRTRGSVAVEFAILLPTMIIMLAAPLLFGRVFWHYTVAQKAAQDAVRFLAAANAAEIKTPGAGGAEAPVAAVARAIVLAEIAELSPGPYTPGVDVLCDGGTCFGFLIPTRVTVRVTMPIYDEYLNGITSVFTSGDQILINPVATTNYVGN